MIASKITNHIQQGLQQLLQQYKGRPYIAGFYSAFLKQIQDLEEGIFSIDAGRQLWDGTQTNAFGQQLDSIGTIVGIARNGLSDEEYLLFIFGKIAQNNSDTSVPTILTIIGYVFQAQQVLLQEVYPAGISIQVIGTPIPVSLYKTAAGLVAAALGAGINLVFVGGSSTTNVFRFYGPGVVGAVNGFGSLSDPSIGGGFVGLI